MWHTYTIAFTWGKLEKLQVIGASLGELQTREITRVYACLWSHTIVGVINLLRDMSPWTMSPPDIIQYISPLVNVHPCAFAFIVVWRFYSLSS